MSKLLVNSLKAISKENFLYEKCDFENVIKHSQGLNEKNTIVDKVVEKSGTKEEDKRGDLDAEKRKESCANETKKKEKIESENKKIKEIKENKAGANEIETSKIEKNEKDVKVEKKEKFRSVSDV